MMTNAFGKTVAIALRSSGGIGDSASRNDDTFCRIIPLRGANALNG